MIRPYVVIAVATLVGVAPAGAQTGPTIPEAPVGTLVASGATPSFAVPDIDGVQESGGRRTYALLGAGIGGVIGVAATYYATTVSGSTALCNHSENQDSAGTEACLAVFALGGLVGAGVGFLVGRRISRDRMDTMPLVSVRPGPAFQPTLAYGLAVRLRF